MVLRKKKYKQKLKKDKKNKAYAADNKDAKEHNFLTTKIIGAVVAAASAVVFYFTEWPLVKMTIVDKWTILMVGIALVHGVVLAIGLKTTEKADKETK